MDDSIHSHPAAVEAATALRAATVRVLYLARLREALGRASETIALTGEGPTTVADLRALLRARGGAWGEELAPGRAIRFAVNQRVARSETPVVDGDEVAVFPPVTGG